VATQHGVEERLLISTNKKTGDSLIISHQNLAKESEQQTRLILVFGRQAFALAAFCERLGGAFPSHNVVSASVRNMLLPNAASQIDLVVVTTTAASHPEDMEKLFEFLQDTKPQPPLAMFGDIGFRTRDTISGHCNLKGIFPDQTSDKVVVAGLRFILDGGAYFPDEIVSVPEKSSIEMCAAISQSATIASSIDKHDALPETLEFTSREQSVLDALSKGHTNKAIARDLNIAENTIKVHVRGILRKLQVSNRTEAVVIAQRLHLTTDHALVNH
jgi:DNA-binding NarL/FixJ family response regulator